MKHFEGLTRAEIKRMPLGELHNRGLRSVGFKKWVVFCFWAALPQTIGLLIILVIIGIAELVRQW